MITIESYLPNRKKQSVQSVEYSYVVMNYEGSFISQ